MSSEACLCLGGNAPQTRELLVRASQFIETIGTVVATSGIYPTASEYDSAETAYLNLVLRVDTSLSCSDLVNKTKEYESAIRNREAATVNLDIDVVCYGEEVLRKKDFAAAYFRKGLELLK